MLGGYIMEHIDEFLSVLTIALDTLYYKDQYLINRESMRHTKDVNVNIRMYNFDDVQCTVIPSVAYGFVTGMNLQLC